VGDMITSDTMNLDSLFLCCLFVMSLKYID